MKANMDFYDDKVEILIVEDSPTQAERLKYLLEQEGFRVKVAGDGNQALALLGESKPTIIITDIVMPGMNGYELCNRIKSDKSTQEIPVILLTSLTSSEDVLEGLACGAENFITKPYSEEYLLSIISRIITSEKIRNSERVRIGVEVLVGGQRRFITADQQQMLSLLLSTYEAAVQRNIELTQVQDQLKSLNERLEELVQERTAELSREIIERKRAEERERHLNVVLRSIRAVNQLIVREKERERLIQIACDRLVDARGINSVWVVLTDGLSGRVEASQKGFGEENFSDLVDIFKKGEMPACFHSAQAVSGIKNMRDFPELCEDCPMANTYKNAIAMSTRIEHEGQYFGYMGFSVPPEYATDGEEISLLGEIAGDIAFALYNIELEEKRSRMAKELKNSEERYRSIFEGAAEGILISDPETLKIKYVNPAMCQMLGYTEDEMKQITVSDIHPDDIMRHAFSEFDAHKPENISMIGEDIACLKKDGTTIYADIALTPKILIDGTYCTASFFLDITQRKKAEDDRKKMEEQLLQSQKLEAVGRLTGGIAHDFNNILTTIIGNADIILMGVPNDDPMHDDLKEIRAAGDRAASLIRQLLAFSRKQILQPMVISLNDTVNDIDKMLRRIIGEDIELRSILTPDLGQVEADPGQIEQVIMNLVVNARDAMHEGGKITIETENADLDEEYSQSHIAITPGPYVMLSVSDTGMGMTKEVQEHLFEPFFTTKEKGKGTGLGLSTVYGIVKQSKGYIWVYSEPGKVTTFKVYLPRVDKSIVKKKKSKEPKTLTGSETILVVEDNEMVRNFTVKVLKGSGYRVLTAADGQEAVRISGDYEGSIHLVLTDVVMPGMSGRDLEEKLKASRPAIKVLYMSGYTDNAIVHHGVLELGKMFLQKPFTIDSLGRKVREVLDFQ